MKKYKLQILKGLLAALSFTISALILLPGVIVTLYPAEFAQNIRELPQQIHLDKVDIPDYINVYRTASGVVEAVPFEDYVKGVVSGEMPSSFEEEALKAQAVAARTYSLSKIIRSGDGGFPAAHPTAALCDSTHCQVYRSPTDLAQIKSAEWMSAGWPKIVSAVDDTKGQVMYYDGKLAEQALFHSSSGGKTENSEDVFASAVPYLRSVDSPYEEEASHRDEQTSMSVSAFVQKVKRAYPSKAFGSVDSGSIRILSRTSGGRVEALQIGGDSLSGRNIRDCLGLASANFTVDVAGDQVTFTTNGYGHGVGMSQYGANGMAKEGYDYKEILAHYYSGVVIY